MILSPRLEAIARCVPQGSRVLDVGTDHGYIPVWLVENHRVKGAIASDVSPESLEKARQSVAARNLAGRIDTRLGSGLTVIGPGECDGVIMAGMGGYLIRDLLAETPPSRLKDLWLVLQPMNNGALVRHFLEDHHYRIVKEKFVCDRDIIYEVITAYPGEMTITDQMDYIIGFGPAREPSPVFGRFVREKIADEKKILNYLPDIQSKRVKQQEEQSKERIRLLEEVLNECEKQSNF